MREPEEWMLGYHADGYGGECAYCGATATLDFAEDTKEILSIRMKDEAPQEQIMEIMQCWVLLKLERVCEC